ncbi:MAG: carbon monoxide dehydrogenase, partial [Deltaproteobacteria bacterium]|nr:carbon monoxide dehydrogenase [Deltaproteobacteria bacterium]
HLHNIAVVGNKIRGQKDEDFLRKHLAGFEFIGFLPYDDALIEADIDGLSPFDVESSAKTEVQAMIEKL